MEKIGLLIDSTTLTRPDILNSSFTKVAYLNVSIDNVDYTEKDLSTEAMIHHLHNSKKMTTSQPAPGAFLEQYEAFEKEGYSHILVITLSEKISGTFQSANIAKDLFEGSMLIEVFSPQVASFGVANAVVQLQKMIQDGTTFEKLQARMHVLFDQAAVLFTLSDLMHLFRGGRLSRVQALLGTMLRIKPIIEMVEGKLALTKKERTNQACFEYFMEVVKSYAIKYQHVYIDIIQLNRPEWAIKLKEAIESTYPNTTIYMTTYVSPVFFVHLGDQGFGIAIAKE